MYLNMYRFQDFHSSRLNHPPHVTSLRRHPCHDTRDHVVRADMTSDDLHRLQIHPPSQQESSSGNQTDSGTTDKHEIGLRDNSKLTKYMYM